jgi:ornithine cyclodeaminase
MTVSAIPLLDSATVAARTPMALLIDRLRGAFAESARACPGRLTAGMDDGATLLVMPAWDGRGWLGVKVVTVDPRMRPSVRSTYLLSDLRTGEPVALLDGTMLTRRRTAAISALAATMLARPDSRELLLLGTGALIAPLIEAYAGAFTLARIRIWGRDHGKAEAAAMAARQAGYPVEAVARLDEALLSCDIVSAATLATKPLIAGESLRPGTHVDLIGAFRREMREADEAAFARSRVFVDTPDALKEAGDLIRAIETGHLAPAEIEADMAALCSGVHHGRGDDADAITLFKSVGTATADLAAAALAVSEPE